MVEEMPLLMRPREARKYMGLKKDQMRVLYADLHMLNLPRNCRRIAVPYIHQFREYIPFSFYKNLAYIARQFVEFSVASESVASAEMMLDDFLGRHISEVNGQPAISARDLAESLNVHRTSIFDWSQANKLETFQHDQQTFIGSAALSQVASWRRPRNFPGDEVRSVNPLLPANLILDPVMR